MGSLLRIIDLGNLGMDSRSGCHVGLTTWMDSEAAAATATGSVATETRIISVEWPTRAKSVSKMLRTVENERFRFEIELKIAILDCTLER